MEKLMQIGQTMTAVRALLAGGVVAIAGGAVVLLSSSGLLYAVAAFGVIAAGLLLVAGGATGSRGFSLPTESRLSGGGSARSC
jgi:hypothetical protein